MKTLRIALLLVAGLAAGLFTASAETYSWTTLAGNRYSPGSNDGTGSAARFSDLEGLAVDSNGNVFVADHGNSTIRKITPSGVVTTFAGTVGSLCAGIYTSLDGTGTAARFVDPEGMAMDRSNNLYVADNNLIRKITPAGVVTTLADVNTFARAYGMTFSVYGVAVANDGTVFASARNSNVVLRISPAGAIALFAGTPSVFGRFADGPGSAARFNSPEGLVVDNTGNVFVADAMNCAIRKITPSGVVTTLAGSTTGTFGTVWTTMYFGTSGYADGVGTAARFSSPRGIAMDGEGNLLVADYCSSAIRQITPAGVVTTVLHDMFGTIFVLPQFIAVDANGYLYVTDGNVIRKGVPFSAPAINRQPAAVMARLGDDVSLSVDATGVGLRYQWRKAGVDLPGASDASCLITRVAADDMGFYSVTVTNDAGSVESDIAVLTVATGGTSRLSNLSTRGFVPAGGDLTVGFFIRGGGGKSLLVRAVGPTLGSFGVAGALADPQLDVIPVGASVATYSCDDWGGEATLANEFARVGAFPVPATSKDAAVLATLPAAGYTARITSAATGGSGLAIAEVYDRDSAGASSRLVSISTRGFVGTAESALVPGFVIDGTAAKQVLIRAIGPGLVPFGVTGILADPQLAVIPFGQSFTVASNDNWDDSAATSAVFTQAGAFALAPGSKDAALVMWLPPGGYTVIVSGAGNTTGTALVEIYDLDP